MLHVWNIYEYLYTSTGSQVEYLNNKSPKFIQILDDYNSLLKKLVFGCLWVKAIFFNGLWTSRVYIYHELKPNVRPYAMHGAYGMVKGVN